MLNRGMGQITYGQARMEFDRRVQNGEFLVTGRGTGRAAGLYTTAEMIHMEREMIKCMRIANRRDFHDPMLASPHTRIAVEDRHRN